MFDKWWLLFSRFWEKPKAGVSADGTGADGTQHGGEEVCGERLTPAAPWYRDLALQPRPVALLGWVSE